MDDNDISSGGEGSSTAVATLPPHIAPRRRSTRRRSRRTRLRRWIRDHKALSVLIGTALTLVLALVAWLLYLGSQLGDINRFDIDLDRPDRPARVAGAAVNILLLGVDDSDYLDDVGPQLDELVDGEWESGAFRSDTMMVLHVNASGTQAQLVSVPRDSWVHIPGHGDNKINAALSLGGPELAARTVEDTFGIHLDHVMLIDFQGLRELTGALGGVDVHVPETVVDTKNDKTWTRGTHHVQGDEALLYVRQRYGLPRGDFDRIERQQNLLRAVLDKAVHRETLVNPLRITRLVRDLSTLVAVDSSLTDDRLREIAWFARGLRSHSVRFLTVPHDGTGTVGAASVVKLRRAEARAMFRQIELDRFEGWYADHPVDVLPARDEVD